MLSTMSNTEPLFVPEQLYHRRRDIHACFGGQEQGGMVTPANHKLIFLVTGNSGRQPPAIYTWAADRLPSESWPDFVERGATDALAHVEKWPNALELPPGLEGRIMCCLTWVSELEYGKLSRKAV
jgi:hypothetical protein